MSKSSVPERLPPNMACGHARTVHSAAHNTTPLTDDVELRLTSVVRLEAAVFMMCLCGRLYWPLGALVSPKSAMSPVHGLGMAH